MHRFQIVIRRYQITMHCYQIIDPEINAKCDIVYATTPRSAINVHVRKAGWNNYKDFRAGASLHSGVRSFEAKEILPQQAPMLMAA